MIVFNHIPSFSNHGSLLLGKNHWVSMEESLGHEPWSLEPQKIAFCRIVKQEQDSQ